MNTSRREVLKAGSGMTVMALAAGAGLLRRDYEATIPPKVTYSLTRRGHELDEVLGKLADVAIRWEAEDAARRSLKAAE